MKLLGLEAVQNATYYLSRYRQLEEFGADLYVLNGQGDPGFWPADRYRVAGSRHIDDIVAAARGWHAVEHFDGVLTFSESAVVAVAAVAEALGLPGVGVETARTSRNKFLMRQAHERADVPRPAFRLVPDLPAALAAAGELGYPVILKPTLGGASNFVFRVNGPDVLRLRFGQALAGIQRMSWFTMEAEGVDLGPHGLLIESFLDGPEFLTEALAWDEEVYLGSIVDRVTVEGDTFDDDVHHAPTSLRPDQVDAVHRVIADAAHAQGIRRSVMHAEVRFHHGEPHLLEIAVRPGGGGLDYFARVSAGYSPLRVMMDVACGVRPQVHHYRPTGVHTAGTCLISGPGRIEEIHVPPAVAQSDRVFFLKIAAKPGDEIKRPPHGNNILGFLCTTGTSFDDAMQAATQLAAQIDVRLAAADPPSTRQETPAMEAKTAPVERVPADIMQDPYGLLDRFRADGPVREVVWAHGARGWLVTRYEEISALVNDPRISKDGRRMNELFARHSGLPVELEDEEQAGVGFNDELATHMLNSDPPRHTRLRALVSKAFSAHRVERLRPRIEQVADELLDAMDGKTHVDLVSAFAVQLPLTTICDLFGIPAADREQFRLWGAKLVGAGQDPDEVAEAGEAMVGYVSALVDAKRAQPGDDMVSALVRARDDGDRLTQGELVSMIYFLAVAGHITTICTIGNAVYNLLTHPEELAKLRADTSLMPAAVDELMRFDSAAQTGTFRFTTAEIKVGDVVIPPGELLVLSWSSGNRDSAQYPDANRLDLDRHPAGIMSFGYGLHRCIGVPLAKMQIEVALTRLLARYPDLRLAVEPDEIRWENSALLRSLLALPVSVTPVPVPVT